MRHTARSTLGVILLSATALAGCSSGSGEGPAEEPEATEEAPADDSAAADSEEDSAGGEQGDGTATLTIGGDTWRFDNFLCVFGHEANESDEYVFVSYAEGEHTTGAGIQLFVQVRDDTSQGRYEGDGVVYEIEMFDSDDFENPSVHVLATSDPSYGDMNALVSVDGDAVTAEGTFFDDATFGTGAAGTPGTVDATCGAGSIR